MNGPSASRLLLNVSPVVFDPALLDVETSPYVSAEHIREVRDRNAGTHIVFRIGNELVVAPATADARPVGLGTHRIINVQTDVRTGARVVRNALVSYFHALGRTLLDFDPVVFIAAGRNDDLIGQATPQWVTRPQWLNIAPRYTLDVRSIQPTATPMVGVTVDVESTIRIDATCATLIEAGVSLIGWYISQPTNPVDVRVQPRRRLLGRVAAVEGSVLHLTDTREGNVSVDAASAYPEPRWEALRAIVAASLETRAERVLGRIDAAMRRFHQGPERLARLRALMQHIGKNTFRFGPDVMFTIQPFLAEGSASFPAVERAPRPTYVFDPASRKTDTWNDRGLKQYGPYTAKAFSPSRPRVAVICQSRFQGVVEQVVYKLLHGVSSGSGDSAPFEQGFIRKYALQDFTANFFFATDHTVAAYDRASRQALAAAGQQNAAKWDLVLVQTEERFRDLVGTDNPYLVTKATFLSAQTPVQSFKIETVDVSDRQLGYVLNNIALAGYTKMGGVPWLLQANPTIAHEVVVGLGSAELSSTRLGVKQRMVGVTTVFTGDGRYYLSSLSQAAPFDEYADAVLTSLRESIANVKSDFNWQRGERVRLVFHAFKDFRNIEAEAVKRVMRELVDFEVEYAFLHVADTHPFLLFDEAQNGVPAPGGTKKGVLAPERTLFLPLAPDRTLLVLTGPRDVKLASHGLPRPVLLKLHNASTFTDMRYLSRQVATFAAHSWRSFSPSSMPVTILYSELVARLLPQLTAVDPSLATALLGRIGKTRWFL